MCTRIYANICAKLSVEIKKDLQKQIFYIAQCEPVALSENSLFALALLIPL